MRIGRRRKLPLVRRQQRPPIACVHLVIKLSRPYRHGNHFSILILITPSPRALVDRRRVIAPRATLHRMKQEHQRRLPRLQMLGPRNEVRHPNNHRLLRDKRPLRKRIPRLNQRRAPMNSRRLVQIRRHQVQQKIRNDRQRKMSRPRKWAWRTSSRHSPLRRPRQRPPIVGPYPVGSPVRQEVQRRQPPATANQKIDRARQVVKERFPCLRE